ncbi:MAG TPA: hypothetical protein VKW06_22495 [Candidatus Angelobacter sp.]|nr:hypothetical protein [Candidatus Angelobacter sp.]
MSSPLRVEALEQQADRQRDLLQSHVQELRQNVRNRLDVQRNVREHVWPLAGLVAAIGIGLGFTLTGLFTRE